VAYFNRKGLLSTEESLSLLKSLGDLMVRETSPSNLSNAFRRIVLTSNRKAN
jgi:hypothetical protein